MVTLYHGGPYHLSLSQLLVFAIHEVRGEAGSTMEESQQVPTKPLQKLHHIGGEKVYLPVKPYPSQLAMMGQVG
ncbi:hypothetical protein E2C01_063160 [Portunus trituberculatus]|uniref:Uncharacterized protein n=1 Tax=Portunus trituberculatus TaxID=210409 RepID=A0A5B7HI74_PORTR|nr:hypothetical protein [Portunus trituberculatus]